MVNSTFQLSSGLWPVLIVHIEARLIRSISWLISEEIEDSLPEPEQSVQVSQFYFLLRRKFYIIKEKNQINSPSRLIIRPRLLTTSGDTCLYSLTRPHFDAVIMKVRSASRSTKCQFLVKDGHSSQDHQSRWDNRLLGFLAVVLIP